MGPKDAARYFDGRDNKLAMSSAKDSAAALT